jgi:hypothetical protein
MRALAFLRRATAEQIEHEDDESFLAVLLAREYAKAGEPPSPPPAVRPVRELAREMLALRIG